MATPQQGSATIVPVISTWTAGSSTWTATDHWSTVYGNGAAPGAPTAAPTAAAVVPAATATPEAPASSSAAPSRGNRKPDKARLNAMAIMSARNKAVAAQASSTASSGSGSGTGAWTKLGGQWVLPSTGQIYAGGQDVTLSWRSQKRPSDSTLLRLCLLKNEGDLSAVQSGVQDLGSCGTPTTPSIMSGGQPGIWSISFTAPNVTIADSFYVLLTKGAASPSSTKTTKATKTTSTSKPKATPSSKQDDRESRKQDRKQDRESAKKGKNADDEDAGYGDDDDGYSGGSGDSDESSGDDDDSGAGDDEEDGDGWESKGWSSLRRERRSHDAIGSGSGSGSGTGTDSAEEDPTSSDLGSMLSPAFVLAPYGSDTNPAQVQMAAVSPGLTSPESDMGGDGINAGLGDANSSSGAIHRPAMNLAAIMIPLLLTGLALVGCLALLMYRRGRKRASDEAEKVRRTETDAREKAKAEMREFLRRSPSGASVGMLNAASGMGAGGMYYRQSQRSHGHASGLQAGSQPHFRRSMVTPSPSYRSATERVGSGLPYHSASLKSYGHAYGSGAGPQYQSGGGGNVPILAYQDRGAFSVHSANETLQARNSIHSLSSGKSFASASSGISHPSHVRVVVPTPPPAPMPVRQQGPTPPPPVYVNTRILTPPLPPATPTKDESAYLYHTVAAGASAGAGGVGEMGVPLVRSGSLGPAAVPSYPGQQVGYQQMAQMQQGLPTMTFTSPTASSPTSSLWARVTNPFTMYGSQPQAQQQQQQQVQQQIEQQQQQQQQYAINAQNMAQFQAQAQAQVQAQAQAQVQAQAIAQAEAHVAASSGSIPIRVVSPISTYSSLSSEPDLHRPIASAQMPMIQPPIPALVSTNAVHLPYHGHGQEQVITMTVPTALGYETVGTFAQHQQQQQQHGSTIPSVLRNGSLRMMQGQGSLPNPFHGGQPM